MAVWSALFLREPTHPDCVAWQARVHAMLQQTVDPNLKLRAAMLLAKQSWYSGHHCDMAVLGPLMDGELARPGVTTYAQLMHHLARQYTAWAQGDWAQGRADTRAALQAAQDSGIALLDQHLRLHGACFASLDGDEAEATSLLAQVAQRADASRRMEAWHHFTLRAWLSLRRGEVAEAEAAARMAMAAADAMGPAPLAMSLAIRCHALQELGDTDTLHEARSALAQLPLPADHVLARVHGLLIDARMAAALGDGEGALRRTARALGLARAHALWAVMGAPPRPLARLLERAPHAGIEVDTAMRWVRAMRLAPPPGADVTWPLPVRLRGRDPVAIEIDGQALATGGKPQKRPLELLQALVGAGGSVSAARLADQLWPDAEGDLAMGAFEATLRRLRHLLGDPQALLLSGGVL